LNFKDLNEWYQRANHFSGGALNIIREAVKTFSANNASQAAAALAYYAFFSLFPLLIASIAGGSYFLDSQQIFQNVTRLLGNVIPVSNQLIDQNLRQVINARGTVGLLSLLTLLWSGSGVFTNLAHNINLAWPKASRRNFLEQRLAGFEIIGGLSLLLLLSIVLDWVITLAPVLKTLTASSSTERLWRLASNLGTWLMVFLVFLVLYRYIPTAYVHWKATFWGALIASIGWKAATAGFTWYLGFVRFQLVYSSLGAIIALLFLIFIVAIITLFGAHLCAAIDIRQKNNVTLS
jgi:membrane protein